MRAVMDSLGVSGRPSPAPSLAAKSSCSVLPKEETDSVDGPAIG